MKSQDFTYAVARIRVKETKLFNSKDIDRLISQPDYDAVLRTLAEYGYSSEGSNDKDVISCEQRKLWDLMDELVDDLSVFDVFRVQNDFQNLKASVKAVYSNASTDNLFISGGTLEPKVIYEAVKERNFDELPEKLSEVAKLSLDTLLKTGDGQLCDLIIDKACLECVYNIASNQSDIIRDYAELFVASCNIKIAVRGCNLNKDYSFFKKAFVNCATLDIDALSKNAAKGFDEICNYLSTTVYKQAVSSIKESMSAFEKWCDDFLIRNMRSQKSEPFTIGPLVAYIIAKQNEIKAVRLILIAKLNGLDDSKINERIREMYV